MLALVIEGVVILGEQSQAGHLYYPLVRELVGTGAVALWPDLVASSSVTSSTSTGTVLVGVASARRCPSTSWRLEIAVR
jgi:hypothetical protein